MRPRSERIAGTVAVTAIVALVVVSDLDEAGLFAVLDGSADEVQIATLLMLAGLLVLVGVVAGMRPRRGGRMGLLRGMLGGERLLDEKRREALNTLGADPYARPLPAAAPAEAVDGEALRAVVAARLSERHAGEGSLVAGPVHLLRERAGHDEASAELRAWLLLQDAHGPVHVRERWRLRRAPGQAEWRVDGVQVEQRAPLAPADLAAPRPAPSAEADVLDEHAATAALALLVRRLVAARGAEPGPALDARLGDPAARLYAYWRAGLGRPAPSPAPVEVLSLRVEAGEHPEQGHVALRYRLGEGHPLQPPGEYEERWLLARNDAGAPWRVEDLSWASAAPPE